MRFIHTADWHLGRLMHGVHLTEDQAHLLDQLADLIREARADLLLVSGDVFDRAVPPPDAVALLDDFLSRVVLDLRVPVVVIAGNHDSARRLEFGSRVLAGQGLHVAGSLRPDVKPVIVADQWGPVHVYPLPFAEPAVVRESLSCESLADYETAVRAMTDRIRFAHPQEGRSVLVAHAFVSGGEQTESERPLSVGGADQVDPSCFQGFDYVALGHLHRPQTAGSGSIRYAGSLFKYSFSEAEHNKGVHLVEMDQDGWCRSESIPLTPRRDVRRISGFMKDLLNGSCSEDKREDYIMVSLLDTSPILDVMGKLKEAYPNCLHVERTGLMAAATRCEVPSDHRKLSDSILFASFFSQVTGEDLRPEEVAAYRSVVDEMRRQEREACEP